MAGNAGPIPAAAGIGLRTRHMPTLANQDTGTALTVPWLEIHSENFLCAGGPRRAMIAAIAERYPLSCHGVGLSLGSAEGLDQGHLERLATLYGWLNPGLVSEHLSWSVTGGDYLNDLLPLPYTPTTLDTVCRNVDRAQSAFGRAILVENPSAYLTFPASTMREADFLNALVTRAGCGLLLDVNNIYVTATNTCDGGDVLDSARAYIDEVPPKAVGEIHLAGHSITGGDDDRVLIDTHSTLVCEDVWTLYRYAVARLGPRPTLIEWDLDVPELPVLLGEAVQAQAILSTHENGGGRRVA
ncbi:MAG: DUF692 domain-containing protein [Rhodospirillaceae bacterium]|nr:MAG: DUF692 domain-containing protein [Rhodospirillaceae bacterium]